MVSTRVRQSEGSGFKSQSGVKPGSPRKTVGPVSDKIRLGLQWKLRTLDRQFRFLVLKPSGVRFAEVSFRNYLVNWVAYG